jgi:hypothetical protein
MTPEKEHELLIRLDERTARIEEKMDTFATKDEVAYLKRGFWGIIVFVFVALGGAVMKLVGIND